MAWHVADILLHAAWHRETREVRKIDPYSQGYAGPGDNSRSEMRTCLMYLDAEGLVEARTMRVRPGAEAKSAAQRGCEQTRHKGFPQLQRSSLVQYIHIELSTYTGSFVEE